MKKIYRNFILVFVILLAVVVAFFVFNKSQEESFRVNTLLIKQVTSIDSDSNANVKITNNLETEQGFKVYFKGIEDIASVDEEEFYIKALDSKVIVVNFDGNVNEGIYNGVLVIESLDNKFFKEIPVVFGVESKNRKFSLTQNILPQYEIISPGERVSVNLKIFDLEGRDSQDIQIIYSVRNNLGEEIFHEEVNTVILESLDKIETVEMPLDIEIGRYVFVTTVKNENSRSDSASLFTVQKKSSDFFSGDLKYFVILAVVFFFGILCMFYYFIKLRDEFLLKLKRQQYNEIKENLQLVEKYKNKVKKIKDKKERKVKLRKIGIVKKEVIRSVRKKQKQQRKEIKSLKKKGKKSDVEKKLSQWRNEGYELPKFEKELKMVTSKHIKSEMKHFKQKGYKM